MAFSAFAADGRPELNMLVYSLTAADAAGRLGALVARRVKKPGPAR